MVSNFLYQNPNHLALAFHSIPPCLGIQDPSQSNKRHWQLKPLDFYRSLVYRWYSTSGVFTGIPMVFHWSLVFHLYSTGHWYSTGLIMENPVQYHKKSEGKYRFFFNRIFDFFFIIIIIPGSLKPSWTAIFMVRLTIRRAIHSIALPIL